MTAALIILVCLSIDVLPPSFLCYGHELQTILRVYISPLTVQPSRATNAIGRNIGLDVALGFMRMFHFRKSGLGTASAVNGAGLRMHVCVCLIHLCVTFLDY